MNHDMAFCLASWLTLKLSGGRRALKRILLIASLGSSFGITDDGCTKACRWLAHCIMYLRSDNLTNGKLGYVVIRLWSDNFSQTTRTEMFKIIIIRGSHENWSSRNAA
jgi:hypothetical protein